MRQFKADREEKGEDAAGITIRHTTFASSYIEAAKRKLHVVVKRFDDLRRDFSIMAGFRPTERQVQKVLDEVLPYEVTERTTKDSMVGNAGSQNRIRHLMEKGMGTEIPGVRGTGWGLYNAVAEFSDHERVTVGKTEEEKAENRLRSSWIGSGARLKQRTYEAVMALAK